MKLHFKILFMASLFSLCLTSCDQNEAVGNEPTQKELTKKRLFTAAKTATSKSTVTPSTTDEDFASECIATFDCFEYVFPITITNGTEEATINSETELYEYYDTLDDTANPEITFPITIRFDDGTEQTIVNNEELEDAYDTCFGEEEPCFTINFPVTVIIESTTLDLKEMEVTSETELHAFIDESLTDDDNDVYISFKYPITLTLADDNIITIENDDDFDAVYADCYDFEDYDDFEDFECFDIQFPISAQSSSGEVTISNEDDLLEYFFDLGEDEPQINFPVTIKYEDGTTQEINSNDELDAAFDDCFYNEYEDAICFDITYPINLVKNDEATTITVNNDDEFDAFLDGLTDEDYFDIAYPLTVILEDGTKQEINNDEAFIDLVDSCDNNDS